MTRSPAATIVITTCDRPVSVQRAVASALRQVETDIEVLVVDDGTDGGFHRQDTDARVRVLRTAGREGANRARNLGLSAARGAWVCFLDDDDELLPGMVTVSLQAAQACRLPMPVAVLSGMEEVAPDGRVLRTRRPVSLPKGGEYYFSRPEPGVRTGLNAHNTLFAPVALLRDVGGFDEEFEAYMHADLFLRLNRCASLQAVPDVTYRMHHHDEARLSRRYAARARGMARYGAKHVDVFARHPREHARHLGLTGWTFLQGGEWRPAARYAFASFRRDPLRPRALPQLLLALAGPRVAARLIAGLRRLFR